MRPKVIRGGCLATVAMGGGMGRPAHDGGRQEHAIVDLLLKPGGARQHRK